MKLKDLAKPFKSSEVHWRVGSTTKDKSKGMALAYIDARNVQDRLDEVCGPENWSNRFPNTQGRIVCEIGIRVGDEFVWKADGAGDTAVEKEKGGLSDALKRAAVAWGIGRYLYAMPAPWVELDTYKDNNGNVKVKGFSNRAKGELMNIHENWIKGIEPNQKANDSKPQRRTKAESRDEYTRIEKLIDNAPDMASLGAAWKANYSIVITMPVDFEDTITVRKDDKKLELEKKAA